MSEQKPEPLVEEEYVCPKTTYFNNEKICTIVIEMPGIKKEDVSVEIDKGILSEEDTTLLVSGKKEGKIYFKKEMPYFWMDYVPTEMEAIFMNSSLTIVVKKEKRKYFFSTKVPVQ